MKNVSRIAMRVRSNSALERLLQASPATISNAIHDMAAKLEALDRPPRKE
jgi:hypothetical protein